MMNIHYLNQQILTMKKENYNSNNYKEIDINEEKEKSNQIEFNNEDQEALISEKKNFDEDKKLQNISSNQYFLVASLLILSITIFLTQFLIQQHNRIMKKQIINLNMEEIKCIEQLFHNGACISQCPNSYYELNGKCVETCQKYIDQNKCVDNCINKIQNNHCVDTCPAYEFTNNTCTDKCPLIIQNNFCIENCPPEYIQINNNCIKNQDLDAQNGCPENTYVDYISFKCKECEINCQQCTNPNNYCIQCKQGYILTINGKCVKQCEQDYVEQNSMCVKASKHEHKQEFFYSNLLKKNVAYLVILPLQPRREKLSVVIFLHDYGDGYTFLNGFNFQEYEDFIVIGIQGDGNFYIQSYDSYIIYDVLANFELKYQDIIEILPQKRIIAGVGMGAYGAMYQLSKNLLYFGLTISYDGFYKPLQQINKNGTYVDVQEYQYLFKDQIVENYQIWLRNKQQYNDQKKQGQLLILYNQQIEKQEIQQICQRNLENGEQLFIGNNDNQIAIEECTFQQIKDLSDIFRITQDYINYTYKINKLQE